MLHIPQKDIEWYKRRPGYYGMFSVVISFQSTFHRTPDMIE